MYDVTIVGCGVVGASLAYTLSQYRLRVLVLERENDVAMGTTKANSAIVHAGYDPENGTLMAKLNVRGSEVMEQLCSDLSVGYKRIGSFVLAFDEEQKQHLEHLLENGVRNGVPGLRILDAKEAHEMEPNLAENVVAALYAPSAAVIDPWGLCIAEAETAVRNGVELKLRSEVTGIEETLLITSTTLSLADGTRLARSFGGVVFPAHIDRAANGILEILGDIPPEPGFTAAEFNDAANIAPYRARFASVAPLTLLVNSDAHRLSAMQNAEGDNFLMLDAPCGDEEAVRRALFAQLGG